MFVLAGVSGHVGGVAANELLAAKQKIRVIVRAPDKGKPWAAQGAEVRVGKLEETAFLTGALQGATGFFTLLPTDFTAPNLFAAQKKLAEAIASAVKAAAVPHVVLLSSLGAELAEGTGPIKGLHYLENALRATGTKLTAIRASYFQENIANSLGAAKQTGIFPNLMPSRDESIPMIATRDIGALVARSLISPPARSENVDLLGPMYTVNQVAEKLGAALGKQLQIVDIPQLGWVDAIKQSGVPQNIAEVVAEMYAAIATRKIVPNGDRKVQGTTAIDDVIRALVQK
jgi:uncharacterized protein YbjT (DUF2867 family)